MCRAVPYVAAPLGRALLSAIFLASGVEKLFHWSMMMDYMAAEGMVAVAFFLAMAVVFELGGGLSVLLGWKARLGALALVVFLVPVTLIFHDFWQDEGPARAEQMVHFMKNSAILGGLFLLLAHGAGPVSFDANCTRQESSFTGDEGSH